MAARRVQRDPRLTWDPLLGRHLVTVLAGAGLAIIGTFLGTFEAAGPITVEEITANGAQGNVAGGARRPASIPSRPAAAPDGDALVVTRERIHFCAGAIA